MCIHLRFNSKSDQIKWRKSEQDRENNREGGKEGGREGVRKKESQTESERTRK